MCCRGAVISVWEYLDRIMAGQDEKVEGLSGHVGWYWVWHTHTPSPSQAPSSSSHHHYTSLPSLIYAVYAVL